MLAGALTVMSATVHGWGVGLAKTNDDYRRISDSEAASCRYVECQLEPCNQVRSAGVLLVVTVPSVVHDVTAC